MVHNTASGQAPDQRNEMLNALIDERTKVTKHLATQTGNYCCEQDLLNLDEIHDDNKSFQQFFMNPMGLPPAIATEIRYIKNIEEQMLRLAA